MSRPDDGDMSPAILDPADFSMLCQQMRNWCWSAVTTAVSGFVSPSPQETQCQTASSLLGAECCGAPPGCDVEFSLRQALQAAGHLQQYFGRQVTFDVIQQEIHKFKMPVCARIEWDVDGDGFVDGAHFVVIHGCDRRFGVPYVWVKDPDAGGFMDEHLRPPVETSSIEIPFEEFRARYRLFGRWRQTYLVK